MRGLIGRTGGGKTMTLVKELIKALLETERYCPTNLEELQVGRLNEYLQECREKEAKLHPSRAKPPVNLSQRLLVIPKSETRHFYRYRSGGLVLPVFEDLDARGKRLPLAEFNEKIEHYFDPVYSKREFSIGCEYFMSEAHRFFPARGFQEFERPMGFYSTQHRHLDDNVWIESQFPAQIDSNFRELICEWYHVRNRGREVMGKFRQRPVFYWQMFYELPKGKVEAADSGEFKLDVVGIGSCYKTRGAISAMAGNTPEEQKKSKKFPWWALPAFLCLGIVLATVAIMYLPKLLEKGVAGVMSSVSGATKKGMEKGMKLPNGSLSTDSSKTLANLTQPAPVPAQSTQPNSSITAGLTVTGVATRGGQIIVQMSDGTRRWSDSSSMQFSDSVKFATPSSVMIDGVKYPITNGKRDLPRLPDPVTTPNLRNFPTLGGVFDSDGASFPSPRR